uniref:PA domain-containing protein n=1 Tax=Hanusia phi TaxID=3032 RepID=A0A7S0HEQ1_9CRYP
MAEHFHDLPRSPRKTLEKGSRGLNRKGRWEGNKMQNDKAGRSMQSLRHGTKSERPAQQTFPFKAPDDSVFNVPGYLYILSEGKVEKVCLFGLSSSPCSDLEGSIIMADPVWGDVRLRNRIKVDRNICVILNSGSSEGATYVGDQIRNGINAGASAIVVVSSNDTFLFASSLPEYDIPIVTVRRQELPVLQNAHEQGRALLAFRKPEETWIQYDVKTQAVTECLQEVKELLDASGNNSASMKKIQEMISRGNGNMSVLDDRISKVASMLHDDLQDKLERMQIVLNRSVHALATAEYSLERSVLELRDRAEAAEAKSSFLEQAIHGLSSGYELTLQKRIKKEIQRAESLEKKLKDQETLFDEAIQKEREKVRSLMRDLSSQKYETMEFKKPWTLTMARTANTSRIESEAGVHEGNETSSLPGDVSE